MTCDSIKDGWRRYGLLRRGCITLAAVSFCESPVLADCAAPAAKAGAREYFASENAFKFCDGRSWVPLYTDTAAGACAVAGRMDWEAAQSVYRYCNGTNWVRLRKPACTVSSLNVVARATHATYLSTAASLKLSADGRLAYVIGGHSQRLAVYDVSASPATPSLTGVTAALPQLANSSALAKFGHHVFVTGRDARNLAVIDVTNPAAPALAGAYSAGDQMANIWAVDVSADGATAFTASWSSGPAGNRCYIHAINVANPAAPSLRGVLDMTAAVGNGDQYCAGLMVREDVLYVTFSDGAVTTVNVANPAAMGLLARATATNMQQTEGVALSMDGATLLTSSYSSDRLHLWNVTNPAAVAPVTQLHDPARFSGAFRPSIVGDYAFIPGYNDDTLSAVSLANPAAPAVTASVTDAAALDGVNGHATWGRYLYAAVHNANSLTVVDMGCDPLGSARLGACAKAGAVEYFRGLRAVAYCDGADWRLMGYSQHQ